MQQEQRQLTSTDLRTTSASQLDTLGAIGMTGDNRQFSYVGVGASNVTAGQLVVTPAVVANHQGISLTTNSLRAVGSIQLQLTLGATAATKDQYADGYITVVTGTGAGVAYRIKGNSAAALSSTIIVDLYNEEALILAVDNTSTFNLAASPYANCITSTTASHAVGVATCNISANNFGWVQTYGYCAALIDSSAPAKGVGVQQSTATAGAVAALSGGNAILGNTLEATTSTQRNSVWLQIT